MATSAYLGPYCEQAGISANSLLSESQSMLSELAEEEVTKGLMLELNDFRKEQNISWDTFYTWITQLRAGKKTNLASLKATLCRLGKKCAELRRNKEHTKLEALLSKQHFGVPVAASICRKKVHSNPNSFDVQVLSTVNAELAHELHDTKCKLNEKEMETDALTEKLSQLSVRNVNKKLSRRDKKIEELQSQKNFLQAEVEEKSGKIVKLEGRLGKCRKVAERNRVNLFNSVTHVCDLQCDVEQLKSSISRIENAFDMKKFRVQ